MLRKVYERKFSVIIRQVIVECNLCKMYENWDYCYEINFS